MSPDYFLLPVALILLIAAAISMEKRGDSKTNSWMHTFGCWTAIIIAVWMLTWWGFHYVYNHDKLSTWIPPNEFGDMFGALTCLFSGIAIAGVIAMLRQQHEEMKETRKEFSEQTKQFEAQTKQFEEQTKQFNEQIALARQAQKIDAFYRRLSHLRQQHEDIYYYEDKKTYKGIIAIICLLNEAFKLLKDIKETLEKGINKEIILEDTTGLVSDFWPNVYIWAHSYFGIVQEILSENSEISTNNEFLNILVNSLTPAECDLLYIMNLVIDKPEIKQTLKALETSSTLFRNAQSDITYKDECFSLVCEIIRRNLPPLTLPMSTMYNSSTPED